MIQYVFDTVSERDMDLLFMQAISTDRNFASLFVNKIGKLYGASFEVLSVELSKTDKDLGESDITVVLQMGDVKVGLLIEDKVNAIAMDQQASRYTLRGKKGVLNGDYAEFYVFIVCPEQYRKTNQEAVKYEYCVTYEECKTYFDNKKDPFSHLASQQLTKALDRRKYSSQTEINENANEFLRRYISYKNTYTKYADLNLRTKPNSNGYWIEFLSPYCNMWITHKLPNGSVDLTFNKAASALSDLQTVAAWLREHGMPDVIAANAAKSTVLRIKVPVIDVERIEFDLIPDSAIEAGLDAVKRLHDLTCVLEKLRLSAAMGNAN